MDEMQEILEEFFIEAEESLDQLEQDLIQLETLAEEGETDGDTVDRLFRVLHTLKGGAGFLGLEKMAKLAHSGENLLDEVRGGKVAVDKPVMDALLESNDALKDLMTLYRNQEDVESVDNTGLITRLDALSAGEAAPAPAAPAPAEATPAPAPTPTEPAAEAAPVAIDPSLINQDLLAEVQGAEELDPSRDKDAAPAPESAPNQELLAEVQGAEELDPSRDKDAAPAPAAEAAATPPAPAAPAVEAKTEEPEAAPLTKRGDATPAKPANDKRAANDRRSGKDERRKAPRRGSDPQETIRVETHRLDKVMNLVGELVLARNSMVRQLDNPVTKQVIEGLDNYPLILAQLEQLTRVTKDLQMSVLSTRMQPIKKVFDKIPRQVRELKTQLGREVNLVIEGEMTEVDKSLVEDLSDPMVHMIRNALDHGIEDPDEREELGKPREGTVRVAAFYEGNSVVIQVAEDGKGIDPVKIREIAVNKGVVTEAVANSMSDNEAIRLIMAAGFSTAEVISDVSGRGVGMDVVNSKIMDMSGTLDIKSELGMGTTFSIYLPLTLAIVNALVVDSNEEGFAVPIGDISEVIKFAPDDIHKMNENDVIELRGEALPLFYLSKLTKRGFIPPSVMLPPEKTAVPDAEALANVKSKDKTELSIDDLDLVAAEAEYNAMAPEKNDIEIARKPRKRTKGFVVVVRDGTSNMGLVVDKLLGQEEAVVKPVTDLFEFNKAISGATITGDGSVHMILDVPFLIKQMSRV